MENPVIIIGANHIGQNVLDICNENEVEVYCFLDEEDALQNEVIGEVTVMGKPDDPEFLELLKTRCEYFIASDSNTYRSKLSDQIIENYGKQAVNIIHPTAYVSKAAVLGHGNLIDAQTTLKPFCAVGNCCNIMAGAVLEPESILSDFVSVGHQASIGKGVRIEENVFIGNGVTIVDGVTVGHGASIGAGSVVIGDVEAGAQMFGNPAGKM